MQLKTWHKVAISIVTPTVLLLAWAGYRKYIVKKPIWGNADGIKEYADPEIIRDKEIIVKK